MEAAEFLDQFVQRHVMPIPYSHQKKVTKDSYVPLAVGTAQKNGITRRELEQVAGGNLHKFFENAMEEKCDAVARANRARR